MVVPDGFAFPPFSYLVVIVLAAGGVATALARIRPPISEKHVVALAAWMVAGACLRALDAVGAIPDALAPFFGIPAVYLSTFALAGAVWLAALQMDASRASRTLGATGIVLALALVGYGLAFGASRAPLRVFWPTVGLVASVILAALVWVAMRAALPNVTAVTGGVGLLAVFGHALDGVSTAVGIDVLGFGEQSPLSRTILKVAGLLPTADFLGTGWLFVLVKVALAVTVVWLFADYIRDEPTEGYLLLGLVAAVGLGPGVHNLLLFAIAG